MNPEGGDLFGGDYICHGGPPTLQLRKGLAKVPFSERGRQRVHT